MTDKPKPTTPSLRKAVPVAKPAQGLTPELLRRVTTQAAPTRQAVPMEQTDEIDFPLTAGVIPAAQMGTRTMARMTEYERKHLQDLGITEDMPLPKDIRGAIRQIEEEQAAAAPPLMQRDPRKPLEIPQAVPLDKRSPEHQAKLRKILESAVQSEQTAAEAAEREARYASMSGGVGEAAAIAEEMAAEVVNDLKPPVPGVDAPHTSGFVAEAQPSPTGAAVQEQFCQQCGHPHGFPTIPEPSYEKKLAFLQTTVGECPFRDEQTIMGGNIKVAFRTLSVKELEVIYAQAHNDMKLERISTTGDYYENLNTYRLCLQLVHLKATTIGGFNHVMPEGLSPETNDMAASFWETDEPENGDTALRQIFDYIDTKVLKTETMRRLIHAACNQFNRLVAKMEANQENSDFWKPTDGQS